MSKRIAFLIAGSLSSVSTAALAQSGVEPPTEIDEVIVIGVADRAASTATRVPLAAVETPFTITTLPDRLIENAAAQDFADVLRYGAIVGGTDNFGNAGQFFSSRGFQLDNGSNYYRDGLRYRKFGQVPLYDIERVEILRGPASVLYGAVQPGGVVNIVSRTPQAEPEHRLRLRGGEDDFGQVIIDSTGPIGDRMRYRVQGLYEDAGSFRDILESESSGATATLEADLSSRTLVTVRASLFNDRRNGDRGVPTTVDAAGAIRIADLPRSRFLGEPFDYLDFRDINLSASLRHELNDGWQIRADVVRSDQVEDRVYIWGGPPGLDAPVPLNGVMNRTLGEWDAELEGTLGRVELAGEARLGPTRHRLLVGIEAERFDNLRSNKRFSYPSVNIYNPVYLTERPVTPQIGDFPFEGRFESNSFYIQDVIDIGERVVVLAGLRYDDISDANLLNGSSQVASETTPQLGLVYRITPGLSAYGSYARSFNPQGGADAAGNPFEPQRSEQSEAGIKWDIRRFNAFATVSAYRLEKANVPVPDPDNPGFSRLSGLQRSQGVEASLDAAPTEAFRVSINYAYSDEAKFVVDRSLAGRSIRNVPRHAIALWAEYGFSGPLDGVTAGLGATHIDERWGNDRNQFRLPPYTLIDGAVRYAVTPNVEVSANLKNIFDETYYTGSLEHRSILVGQPRTLLFGLNLTL